jgi:hypothetical protein
MRSLASPFVKCSIAALGLALWAGAASAQGNAVFREVRIDMSGLPAGAAETRQMLGACLAQNIPLAFAGRVNPGARNAPVLIVRPTGVWLAPPSAGSGDDRHGGSRFEAAGPDFMEGEALIGGKRVPLSVSGGSETPALAGPMQQAQRRTNQLCQSFAYWLARRV